MLRGFEYNLNFHGTCTADLAVGCQYGVSNSATLVVVMIGERSLAEVMADLREISFIFQTTRNIESGASLAFRKLERCSRAQIS